MSEDERYEVRIQTPIGWLTIGSTKNLEVATHVAKRTAENERTVGRVFDLTSNDSRLGIVFEYFGLPPEPDPWEADIWRPLEPDGCDWPADGF